MQLAEKMRYSEEELKEFKLLIEEKLSHAREEYQTYLLQLKEMSDSPDAKLKNLDDGSGTSEMDYLTKSAARQEKYIKHLENALIRIENKVYGVCRETGKLIPKERLRMVPHATLSVEAKEKRGK